MSPDRMHQVYDLYTKALDYDEGRRNSFLNEACAGDEELRKEVESLLAEEKRLGNFMEEPALKTAARELVQGPRESWVGRQIGHYEILAFVGAGGMGDVYRARDSRLKRDVAIKVLPDAFARDTDRVLRFRREAEVLASLNHPHIAAIYDIGEFEQSQFLVLELVDGETLAERVAQGPLPLDEALSIAAQIADALEAAHDKGIIHRDLKPANVKCTRDGNVKILDFGLAKITQSGSVRTTLSNSPTTMSASVPGALIGTVAYMSPEQAKGKELDRTTDMWAFGCVLFEMLTGRAVFEAETAGEILGAIFRAEPDWTALPPETPQAIRRLLRRCLHKDRTWRTPAAADARIEIAESRAEANATDQPPAVAAPAVGSPGRREKLLVAAVIILAVSLVAIFRYARRAVESSEMRVEISTPPPSEPVSFAVSPDGRKLAFVASERGEEPRLWVRPLDAASAQPLAGTEGASYPFWSPDNRFVGFFAGGKLQSIDAAGGPPRTLAEASAGRGGAWSGSGVIVFSRATGSALYRVQPSGGEVSTVTMLKSPRENAHRFPQFLPDNRHFLFFVQGVPEAQGIYIGSLDSPESKRVMQNETAGAFMLPDWLLFVRQGTLVAQHLDVETGQVRGNPVTVADPVAFDNGIRAGAFSVSAAGMLAYRAGTAARRQLTWFDRSGKALAALGPPDENNLNAPSLSPDGRRAAVFRTVQDNVDAWIFDSSRVTRLTFDSARDMYPVWTHDGKRIAFDSSRKGHRDLYWKPWDNPASDELLFESNADKGPNDFSPDGRFLLYVEPNNPDTGADLFLLPLEGERKPSVFLKTKFHERQAQFSPDGQWVAYQSTESGRYEIYARPFPGPGGQRQVSTSGGIQPRWRRDGKEIYYISPDGKLMAVPIEIKDASLEPATPSALFQTRLWGGGTNSTNNQQYDVAPDGRFLMDVTIGEAASPITLLLNWKPPAE